MVATVRVPLRRFLFVSCVLLLLAAAAVAQTPIPVDPPDSEPATARTDETPSLWFVELASPPTADGTRLSTVRAEKAAFRANAQKAGLSYQERYAFDTLFNGLSVRIDKSQIAALARVSGVKAIWPVDRITADVTPPPQTDLYTAISMTGADIVQSELGFTGSGVKVGIIDTGVDYDHPDLGGCFGPGCRVRYGWDFVGDDYNTSGALPENYIPVPDDDPDDCNGHGTHVAGIVGANGGVTGVAPNVTFGAYRVFGCEGTTDADIMIAAMERALADGMQVVNMSIGSSYQWPQYPTAMAGTRLVNKGVVVVASIGNSGANGLWSASAPGVGEKVIGVASFDNTHWYLNEFTISPDDTPIGYLRVTGVPAPPTSGTFPMARTGTPTTPNDGCAALPAGSLAGKVALIRRGTCTFYQKAMNAQNAGAAGVVLYNNTAGYGSITAAPPAGQPPVTIPVVFISRTEGILINNRLAAGPVDMTWTDSMGSHPSGLGNVISSFSSWGLSPDLTLKPDLGAPGGIIFSTYPLEYGGYATISGTSMASPHVAGGAALLLEARPNTPSQAVGGILQNTASPREFYLVPGYIESTHRQGAGMLQIDKAILATTRIDPAKLSLGESEFGPVTRTLTLKNSASYEVTYDLSDADAISTGPDTFAVDFWLQSSTVTFSDTSVTVPPHGMASVNVTIAPDPTFFSRSIYSGYIVLTPQGGGQVYRVPYAGIMHDYQSFEVLGPADDDYPALTRYDAVLDDFLPQPAGTTFTMEDVENIPFFAVHLDHASEQFRMEVFDANTGKSWFRAYEGSYFPRNSTQTGYFVFPWDGWVTIGAKKGAKSGQVPDGEYVVKISILKALGDASNPAHWEEWTSPMLVVDRP